MTDYNKLVGDAYGDGMVAKALVYQEYEKLMANPIPTYAAQGEHLPSFAAQALSQWRPYDTRWYIAQNQFSDYCHSGSSLSGKIQQHTKVSLLGVSDSAFEMGLFMDQNIDAFEKYNTLVRKSWYSSGEVEVDDLGRASGSSLRTKYGGIATPVNQPSPHRISIPDGPVFTDMLADVPLPQADWQLKAILKVKVSIHGDDFVFAYKVRSDKGILLEGTLRDPNLRQITRSLYHVVFGSTEKGKHLDMLDGYRQLLAGEKLPGAVSVPETYARTGGHINKAAEYSPWLALFIFVVGFFQGFGVPDLKYWIGAGVAFLPSILAPFLVPVMEAKEHEAASKSIE